MIIRVIKDDIFVAKLNSQRLSREARDAKLLVRMIEQIRLLGEQELEDLSKDAQRLLPPLKRRVAAMKASGELDEAKAKRAATLAEKDRRGFVIPGGPFWQGS